MALTPFTGETPQRNQRSTFSSRVDAFITWFLGTFWTEFDAAVLAFTFNSTNSVSLTSNTVAVGTKAFVTDASKSYVPGMTIKIAATAEPWKWMVGEVITYDSGTGDLEVSVRGISTGTGSFADWTISMAATAVPIGQHEVVLSTGNGYGSTNTKIRRYTTIDKNEGTSISYVDSATLGASFTINDAGVYTISMNDAYSASTVQFGASLNSAQLTTAINSITAADRILYGETIAAGKGNMTSRTLFLNVGDVVRPHTTGTADEASALTSVFSIVRGNGGGATGLTGAQGNRTGFQYKFVIGTGVSNPNDGNFKFNTDTTSTTPTKIVIDTLDQTLADIADYIATWSVGGTLHIRSNDNTDLSFCILTITGKTLHEVTDAPDWYDFDITATGGLGASRSFTTQEQCVVNYTPPGGSSNTLTMVAQSTDPADPVAGSATQWISDGTATGNAGDWLVKINVGGVVKTVKLVDYNLATIPE